MTLRLWTSERIYYAKVSAMMAAILLLLVKSEQHFAHPLLILLLLCTGYYLGKITCSVHLTNTSLGITLLVFVLMNILHSFIDGISFTGQALSYWLGAIGVHETIRQPTLYLILWAILRPAGINTYLKILVCVFAVTGTWILGIGLGKMGGASFSHITVIADWAGYSIFLFVGDIVHHLLDQYRVLKQKPRF
jgi:hypothetical protein